MKLLLRQHCCRYTHIRNNGVLYKILVMVGLRLASKPGFQPSRVDYQSELAVAGGVSIIANFDEATPNIIGLESRLAQVFVNLITNAVSFVPEGGSVTVSAFQHEHGEVAVLIEDTGCGIPKDNLEDVFKRFYSSRPEQDFGNNSGLGLSISKQIVEAHGGEIWAENIYGDDPNTPTGARFTVLLPV